MSSLQSTAEIIKKATDEDLFQKLIQQLNKDFNLANIYIDIDNKTSAETLILKLHENIYKLIQNRFSDYINLLYIIDVPEKKVKELEGGDTLKLSEQVTFLVLKREWQKVWFKSRYAN